MKKVLVIKTIIITLCLGVIINKTYAQNDADPAITAFGFAMAPICNAPAHVPYCYTTTLTTFFTNAGFTTSIPAGAVGLNISLPTSGEYLASPETIANVTGTFASKFTWFYNLATKTFQGTTNQIIGPGAGGTISITVKGVIPTVPRNSVANIQRLNPAAYPNENINNNNLVAALGVIAFLPIKLLDFTATKQTKSVLLNWRTSLEQNSKNFEVEFSREGTDWQTIGIVNAAGNSSTTKSYSFIHNAPVNGINYYRLKQVDIDAFFEYSPTRIVNFSSKANVNVMPNPTTDRVFITSNGGGSLKSVTVYSIDGKLVQNVDNFVLGSSVNMRNLAPATYILKLTDKLNVSEYVKVVKQ